jgi:hypothetical protein
MNILSDVIFIKITIIFFDKLLFILTKYKEQQYARCTFNLRYSQYDFLSYQCCYKCVFLKISIRKRNGLLNFFLTACTTCELDDTYTGARGYHCFQINNSTVACTCSDETYKLNHRCRMIFIYFSN